MSTPAGRLSPRHRPPPLLLEIDALFAEESAHRTTVGADELLANQEPLTIGGTRLLVWRGDITTLALDPQTQALTDPGLKPTCPRCGGDVFFNVRGGDWFVEAPWRRQFEHLRQWLPAASNDRLLVLDIGSGFNTPGVVRWPMERVAAAIPTARFIRINRDDPSVRADLGTRALLIAAGALDTLEAARTSPAGHSAAPRVVQ